MKTLKRIIAVLLLFITILAVSYVVYTAKQIPPVNTISEVLYEMATFVFVFFSEYRETMLFNVIESAGVLFAVF